jgi:NAD(P)H dehydrogenase (quinone)
MEGGDKLLLISTVRVGSRVEQHTAAVEAAKAAGVRHVVYTSLLGVRTPGNPSVEGFDHLATEKMIEASGLAWTHLRNSLYAEAVATAMAIPALQSGHKPENAGDGRVPIVSRDDCVATAVGVLTQDGHENSALDVTGPEMWTLPDAMALVGAMAGKPIHIERVDDEGMFEYFDSLGVARKASDVVPDGPIRRSVKMRTGALTRNWCSRWRPDRPWGTEASTPATSRPRVQKKAPSDAPTSTRAHFDHPCLTRCVAASATRWRSRTGS